MSYHESSLEWESTATELEEVLKGRPQQVNDHDVETLLSITLLPSPENLREAFQMMPILMQTSHKLCFMCQLGILDVSFFL